MANFAVDPRPHAPRGFTVIPHDPSEAPRRLFAYLGGVMEAFNEDLAIAFFTPAVAKQDFDPMAAALKDFFAVSMGVHLAQVQPSPIGDAFVRFHSPVERERFLGRIIQFSPEYQLSFIKHDAGINVRGRDLDREAWLMVMMFPEDARNNSAISKALAGFGLLRYWYDTDNHARIVVKVHLHDDAEIPHDIVVSAGLPPRVRSWTCPVYILKRNGVTVLGDEDFFPPNGPLHPVPHGPPRWMGPGGSEEAMGPHIAQAHNQGANEEMSAADVGVYDHETEPMADSGEEVPAADEGEMDKALRLVESADALAVVAPPQGGIMSSKVIILSHLSRSVPDPHTPSCFRSIHSLFIDLDTIVPAYVADSSVRLFLATIVVDQQEVASPVRVFGPVRPPVKLVPYSDSEGEEDEDDDVQEILNPQLKTPRKRRARKLKEPLEAPFVRRSRRLNPECGGFRNQASAQAAADNPSVYMPVPLPSDAPATHLSVDIIQGIATNFLGIQPEVVFAAALLELDNDD
ncbi:unnamed protein product [Urochloa humidicola]